MYLFSPQKLYFISPYIEAISSHWFICTIYPSLTIDLDSALGYAILMVAPVVKLYALRTNLIFLAGVPVNVIS